MQLEKKHKKHKHWLIIDFALCDNIIQRTSKELLKSVFNAQSSLLGCFLTLGKNVHYYLSVPNSKSRDKHDFTLVVI